VGLPAVAGANAGMSGNRLIRSDRAGGLGCRHSVAYFRTRDRVFDGRRNVHSNCRLPDRKCAIVQFLVPLGWQSKRSHLVNQAERVLRQGGIRHRQESAVDSPPSASDRRHSQDRRQRHRWCHWRIGRFKQRRVYGLGPTPAHTDSITVTIADAPTYYSATHNTSAYHSSPNPRTDAASDARPHTDRDPNCCAFASVHYGGARSGLHPRGLHPPDRSHTSGKW
jgi:hypothetical protein